MLREKLYEQKNWKGVLHTTWNPKGPGVIRIHMIPPKFSLFHKAPSIVILNGQEILPLNEGWAILLSEFIRQVNEFGPREMDEKQLELVLQAAFHGVREVYPEVSDEILRGDLDTIISIFEDVIHGKVPQEEIGMMSLGEYAPYMRAPHRMDLMISAMCKNGEWHCNQKCLHCYAAGQTYAEKPELSTQQWKRIIAACRKAGIPQLTFTGGEPTMRSDLTELVKEARWFVTRLNTNGVLLTRELAEGLMEAELDSVQVTLYAADPQVHNRLVGAPNFEKTTEGIRNALAAGLNLSVNTPLCSLNADYVQTLKFLHELGVSYVTCSGLIVTGNAQEEASRETQLGSKELYEVVKKAAAYCFANGMEINFTSPGWIDEAKMKALGLDIPSCGACLSNMAVTPDGMVVPCQSWLSDQTLGNMETDSWKKIWNHPVCRKHRKFAAQMKQICPLREKAGEAKC